MATYVGLINYTEQGIRNIQDAPSRAQAFIGKAKEAGVTVKQLLWTVGAYDGLVILEAPDDETVSGLFLSLARAGNVRTQTLRAFDAGEMQQVLSKANNARAMLAEWIRLACSRSVVLRGLKYAAVVGAILVAINHWDALLAGELGTGRLWKIGLTVCVPYLVSTFSSVGALRQAARAARDSDGDTAR